MTVLPIVERELRLISRRRSTFQLRIGAAVVAALGCAWIFAGMADGMTPARLGHSMFVFLTTVSFLYCLFAGVHSTADCLSQEKREGTLGLLFLTDLRGHDVVLGKLASTSLTLAYGLLACFPILSLPLLLGGMSAGQFWRVALALLCTLSMSLAAGIFASTYSWQGRRAAMLAMGWLLVLSTVPLMAMAATSPGANPVFEPLGFLLALSPSFATMAAFDTFYANWSTSYWIAVASQLGLSGAALLAASLAVPHRWQDRPETVRSQSWRERWKAWKLGNHRQRAEFRSKLLDRNPFFWLSSRERLGPAWVWGYLGLVACGWVWGALAVGEDWFDPATYVTTGLLLCLSLKVWIGSEAARRFADDRAAGALELLFSTPMTAREVIQGHFMAMRRQFLAPVILTTLLCVLFWTVSAATEAGSAGWGWERLMIAGYLALFLFDTHTLTWTGFWQGLVSRRTNWAGFYTLFFVMVVPTLLFILLSLVLALMKFVWMVLFSGPALSFGGWFMPVGYFAICFATNACLISVSRTRLLRRLREIAAHDFGYAVPPMDPPGERPAGTSAAVPPRLV